MPKEDPNLQQPFRLGHDALGGITEPRATLAHLEGAVLTPAAPVAAAAPKAPSQAEPLRVVDPAVAPAPLKPGTRIA